MWKDEIVAEIQRHRQEYAAKFQYDLVAISEDLRRRQQESNRKVVTLPPKPVTSVRKVV